MLLLFAAIIGTLGGLWNGGALRHFARITFRWPILFLIGLILRAVAFLPLVPPTGAAAIAFYVAAIVCLCGGMALNRRIVGIELVLIGLLLNAAVILANSGSMPVTADALRLIGQYDFVLRLASEGPIGRATCDPRHPALGALAASSPFRCCPGRRGGQHRRSRSRPGR